MRCNEVFGFFSLGSYSNIIGFSIFGWVGICVGFVVFGLRVKFFFYSYFIVFLFGGFRLRFRVVFVLVV